MTKNMFFWLLIGFGLSQFIACQRRHTCPAYHSAFILDENKTESFFSQFGRDSLPKSQLFVNKNKSGIIVKVRYEQKQKELNSVKMKTVYPPPIDSILFAGTDRNTLGEEEIDSLYNALSIRRATPNRDQEIYMKYIGSRINFNGPTIDQTQAQDDAESKVKEPAIKKKRRWFWNRNRNVGDVEEGDATEEDPVENT